MKPVLNTRSVYLVQPGEDIIIEIVATKVGEFISLVIDGSTKDPASTAPLKYQVPVTKPSGGIYFGTIRGFFPKNAPNDANYQVYVSGSMGGGKFTGSDIFKTDPILDRDITFQVI